MRFHPDELRDQHNTYHDSLDDMANESIEFALHAILITVTFLAVVGIIVLVVSSYWPSQVPLTCQSYIGGEVVACAEGM